MGSATVTENMGEGKYKVRLDKANEAVTDEITKVTNKKNQLINVQIPAIQAAYDDFVTEYNSAKTRLNILIGELRDARAAGGAELEAKLSEVRAQTTATTRAAAARDIAQRDLQALSLQKLSLEKEIEFMENLLTEAEEDIREVWAVDYTSNIAVGAKVGTVEINGEGEQVQITPGGEDGSGLLTPVPVMDEKEYYTSEAFKPGWQKWRPTFRTGEIIDIDYGQNSCDISLDPAETDGLDINQSAALTSVSFEYMTCNASAFAVGDQVVIEFEDQDWSKPQVVGFVESPRACHLQVKIRLKSAVVNQDFLDFAQNRWNHWQIFQNLLADFYSPGPPATGVVADIIQWHQDSVGNWLTALYGAQSE